MLDWTSWMLSGLELVPILPVLFSVSCSVWIDGPVPVEVIFPPEIVVEPYGFWISPARMMFPPPVLRMLIAVANGVVRTLVV